MEKSTAKTVQKAAGTALATTGKTAAANPSTTLFILAGAAVLGIAWVLDKGVKDLRNTFTGQSVDNDISVDQRVDLFKTTITPEQARVFASQLLDAMNRNEYYPIFPWYGPGTDEATIRKIFNELTPEDFKLVYKAFDRKDYVAGGSPRKDVIGGIQQTVGLSKKLDLVGWLKQELGPLDIQTLNVVRPVVQGAGFII